MITDHTTAPATVSPPWLRESPRATLGRPRDPTQPFVDFAGIVEQAKQHADRTFSEALENSPALQPGERVRSQSEQVAVRADNVRTLLGELSDLQDEVFREPGKVNLRALLESLRFCESELEAAVGRLAAELGVVGVVSN
jgi:hypothetical protein